MKTFCFILLSVWLGLGLGCQSNTQQIPQTVSLQYFQSGPQLVKIPVKDASVADSLIALGMDVVVVENDYVIARLGGQEASTVQSLSLKMETFEPEELVQRLIRVVMKQRSDLRELSDTGIDIWEVKGDTVIAQAFDKYIRQIQAKGYAVEILEQNIQNMVKKHEQ